MSIENVRKLVLMWNADHFAGDRHISVDRCLAMLEAFAAGEPETISVGGQTVEVHDTKTCPACQGQKPRRMQGNPRYQGYHHTEHNENNYCARYSPCIPVSQPAPEPQPEQKKPRRMQARKDWYQVQHGGNEHDYDTLCDRIDPPCIPFEQPDSNIRGFSVCCGPLDKPHPAYSHPSGSKCPKCQPEPEPTLLSEMHVAVNFDQHPKPEHWTCSCNYMNHAGICTHCGKLKPEPVTSGMLKLHYGTTNIRFVPANGLERELQDDWLTLHAECEKRGAALQVAQKRFEIEADNVRCYGAEVRAELSATKAAMQEALNQRDAAQRRFEAASKNATTLGVAADTLRDELAEERAYAERLGGIYNGDLHEQAEKAKAALAAEREKLAVLEGRISEAIAVFKGQA